MKDKYKEMDKKQKLGETNNKESKTNKQTPLQTTKINKKNFN